MIKWVEVLSEKLLLRKSLISQPSFLYNQNASIYAITVSNDNFNTYLLICFYLFIGVEVKMGSLLHWFTALTVG